MKRSVVCVATTPHYQRGMDRLRATLPRFTNPHYEADFYYQLLAGWPTHAEKPYAFKAYALKRAADDGGADLVLWCDASILPIRSLEPLWERIEREGYWFARNGWTNYQWTADSAYPDLFTVAEVDEFYASLPTMDEGLFEQDHPTLLDMARCLNRNIPHVVATSFGLNLKSDIGKAFLDEYYRLASESRAFCGPWVNPGSSRPDPCGPDDVLGHRHDQTAASVIAWRLGMQLTDPPNIFAYPPGDEHTILIADGSYE